MKVRLVSSFKPQDWILGKFVKKLQDNLVAMGVECDYGENPDETADINHYIFYREYKPHKSKTINTVMVTHIDEVDKLNEVREGTTTSDMHICMSNQMMHWLAEMGVPSNKLAYVDPAHDQCALIKKYSIGIASRVYPDGRKREIFFNKLAKDLDPSYFVFKFMGAGWDNQVGALNKNGFETVYYNDFIREEYYKFIQSLDFYLYTGHDEGQMGFVDAAAAGVPSIVTPQGYHLDAPEALQYPFDSYEDLRDILLNLQEQKQKVIKSVSDWTWMDYTKKHMEIWQYLMGKEVHSTYKDGINSHLKLREESIVFDIEKSNAEVKKLKELSKRHRNHIRIRKFMNIKKFPKAVYNAIRRRICMI